jgi:hypothetical protein
VVEPTAIDFGTVPIHTLVPVTRTITVTNPSPLELNLREFQFQLFSGAESPAFPPFASLAGGTCRPGSAVPGGGSCTITMEFIPRVIGLAAAELRIVDDAPDSPQVVHLTGTGSPEVHPQPLPQGLEPLAVIEGHPARKTRKRTATFTFIGNPTTAGFVCRLDRGPFRSCTSPTKYRALKPGHHRFTVRATGSDGTQTLGANWGWQIAKPHKKHRHRKHSP